MRCLFGVTKDASWSYFGVEGLSIDGAAVEAAAIEACAAWIV